MKNRIGVSGDSLILTDNGLFPIKDIVGKEVRVWTGLDWADAKAVKTGNDIVNSVELENGMVLSCNDHNLFLNWDNKQIPFSTMRVKQAIALPKADSLDEFDFVSYYNNMWFVAGVLFTKMRNVKIRKADLYQVRCDVCDKDECYRSLLYSICETIRASMVSDGFDFDNDDVFVSEQSSTKTRGGKSVAKLSYVLYIRGNVLDYLEKWTGDLRKVAHSRTIPSAIAQSSFEIRRAFAFGCIVLYEYKRKSNGWSQSRAVFSVNKTLLQNLQLLFCSVGFYSSVNLATSGFVLHYGYRKMSRCGSYPFRKIKQRISSLDASRYDDCRGLYTAHRLAMVGDNDPSYSTALDIFQMHGIGVEEYQYSKIKTLRHGSFKEDLYIMSFDDKNGNFVANGFICHSNL